MNPYREALVQGADGDFYGTTETGGADNYGVVFKMAPGGTVTGDSRVRWHRWRVSIKQPRLLLEQLVAQNAS